MDPLKRIYLLLLFVVLAQVTEAQVYVNDGAQLQSALNNAVPGQTIYIQDGYYQRNGGFYANAGIDGTAANPITVIGSRNAILTTGTLSSSYGFSLKGNKYWIVKGFTVTNSSKGVVLDNSSYVTIDSLCVKKIGGEGIHLRTFTSYCTVKKCFIDSTGLNDYSFGEGIYIGSANSNWCTYTNCDPDTSNYNQVLSNSFGNFVTAENVDIKEGTKNGLIKGNNFNGTGLQDMNGGDSWIDLKGNYYIIEDNVGNNSILDGFQTHIQPPGGYGNYNTFRNNTLNVNAAGYGINVKTSNTNGTALNNIVCSNNQVTGAGSGLTNITTTTCQNALPVDLLYWNAVQQNNKWIFKWKVTSINEIESFIIESSVNGKDFISFSKVPIAGVVYQKEADHSLQGITYFRLVTRFANGQQSYSQIIQIGKKDGSFRFTIKSDQVIVYCSENDSRGILYDQLGKALALYKLKAGYNYLQLQRVGQVCFLNISDLSQQKCIKIYQ
jgi:hypothetical protein